MGASMAMDASMYDTHSLAQASLHSLASPMLKTAATAAARAALAFGSEAIRILVIGAATGSNDVAAINMHVVPAMRAAAPALPVSAVFTDVPSNDWNVLVLELTKLEGVSVSSASIGFLDAKIVLDQSIHLVLCFSALHWQSKLPWGTDTSELNEAISYLALPPRPKAQIVASADAQLARFFKHRMAELVPGGQIVAVMDGESSESAVHQFALTYQLLRKALGSMIDERLIPRAVLSTFFFATVPYSEARIKTILEAQGGCDLAEHSWIDMQCPYELQFNASGDARTHGEEVSAAAIACFKKELEGTLQVVGVPADRLADLMRILGERSAEFAAAEPRKYNTGGVTAFVRVAKKPLLSWNLRGWWAAAPGISLACALVAATAAALRPRAPL